MTEMHPGDCSEPNPLGPSEPEYTERDDALAEVERHAGIANLDSEIDVPAGLQPLEAVVPIINEYLKDRQNEDELALARRQLVAMKNQQSAGSLEVSEAELSELNLKVAQLEQQAREKKRSAE